MSAKRNLKAVPDTAASSSTSPNQRALTTSFRIPIFWHNKVKEEAERLDISLSQVYLRALMDYFGTFQDSSWSTDDPQVYDSTMFYTRSQDKQGHSTTFHFGIPKPLAAEISALVASGMVPAYRNPGDVMRDATYHRLKQIATMIESGTLDTAVNMAMLMSDEMRIVDEAREVEQLIDVMRSNAQAMYGRSGSTTRLRRYLAERREIADSIPMPYRDDYISAIEDYEKRIEPRAKKPRRKPGKK